MRWPQGTLIKVQSFKREGETWLRILEGKAQVLQTRSTTFGEATLEKVVELARRYASGDIPRVALKKAKQDMENEFKSDGGAKGASKSASDDPAQPPKKTKRAEPAKEAEPAEQAPPPKQAKLAEPAKAGKAAKAKPSCSSSESFFGGPVPDSFEESQML